MLNIDGDDSTIDESLPFVTALARGLAVIRAFGPDRAEPTLTDLAKATEAAARHRQALCAHAGRAGLRAK